MGNGDGKLIGIARATKVRDDMEVLERTDVTVEAGVEGDRRGAVKGAQVTVLSIEDWKAACAEVGADLAWTTRRANLLVEGVSLPQRVGAEFAIGDVVLVVREETDPCSQMEKAHAGLKAAMTPNWRGGIRCDVVRGGTLEAGALARCL